MLFAMLKPKAPRAARTIGEKVDSLGRLKAKIAALTEIEKTLKNELIAAGVGAHDGELFHVCVSEAERETVDKDALVEKLSALMEKKALAAFLRRNTKKTTVVNVKVTARLREAA